MRGSKRVYWVAQIIGWGLYAFLSFFTGGYMKEDDSFSFVFFQKAILFALSGLLITHEMRSFMLRLGWLDLPFMKASSRIFLLVMFSAFGLVNSEYIIRWSYNDYPFSVLLQHYGTAPFYISWLGAFLLLVFWNAIYFTYYFFNKFYFQAMDNLRLQSVQHEIELKNLKSQLNPHFLFNSLNSIRALI